MRRLTAEQLLDCQSQVLAAPARFNGYPLGTRAVQMAGALPERRGKKTDEEQFLAAFGKTTRLLPTECERSNEPTISQTFQLMSGPLVHELLTAKANRISALMEMQTEQAINEIFWTGLSRAPSEAEKSRFAEHLNNAKEKRAAWEDILWSVVNSKEFLFR